MNDVKTYKIGSLEQGFPGMEDARGRGMHPFAFSNLENVDFTPLGGLSLRAGPELWFDRGARAPGNPVRQLRLLREQFFLILAETSFEVDGSFVEPGAFPETLNIVSGGNLGIMSNRPAPGMTHYFVTDGGVVVNTQGSPTFAASGLTCTPGGGGQIPAGNYAVFVYEMRELVVGTSRLFVRCTTNNAGVSNLSVNIAANGSLTISSTHPTPVVAFIRNNATFESYEVGVFTSSINISRLPLRAGQYLGADRQANVIGEVAISAHGRTWVAGRAFRNRDDDVSGSGGVISNDQLPLFTTVYYSSVGQPWAFPIENYFTIDALEGRVTAMAALGQSIVVFTQNAAVLILGNSGADFNIQRLPGVASGVLAKTDVCEYGGVVYFVNSEGVFAVTPDGQVTEISLSIRERFLASYGDPLTSRRAIGVDSRTRKLRVVLGDVGGNGTQFVFDLRAARWTVDTGRLATAISSDGAQAFFAGVNDNQIYRFDSDQITTTTAKLTLEFMDLDEAETDKRPLKFRAEFDNLTGFTGTANLKYQNAAGAMVSVLIQAIPAGRSLRVWSLPSSVLVGRGARFELEVIGRPGLQVLAPMGVDFRERRRRQS